MSVGIQRMRVGAHYGWIIQHLLVIKKYSAFISYLNKVTLNDNPVLVVAYRRGGIGRNYNGGEMIAQLIIFICSESTDVSRLTTSPLTC